MTLFSLWFWVCVFRDSRYTTLICPFHLLTILFSNSCCFPPFFFYHYLSIFDLLPTANNWYNMEALDTLPKIIFHSYLWYLNSPLLVPRSYRVSAALHMTTCHFPGQYVLPYWHAKTTSVSRPCSRFLSTRDTVFCNARSDGPRIVLAGLPLRLHTIRGALPWYIRFIKMPPVDHFCFVVIFLVLLVAHSAFFRHL